tara:strand:- start:1682 stop:2161 length:480 start_codon:yes stop_codon:yes gene_type:complete
MDINNYPMYLIYDDGGVFSKYSNRFLSRNRTRSGYNSVDLYKNKIPEYHDVHRLVAIHYIPNPYNKKCVDHIDGNRLNNNVNNLRWMTHSENVNAFQKLRSNNKSGHKNVQFCNLINKWFYRKNIYKKLYFSPKKYDSKIDAICYKYIFILKRRAGLLG